MESNMDLISWLRRGVQVYVCVSVFSSCWTRFGWTKSWNFCRTPHDFLSTELNRQLGFATILSLGWFCWKHQTQKHLKTSEVNSEKSISKLATENTRTRTFTAGNSTWKTSHWNWISNDLLGVLIGMAQYFSISGSRSPSSQSITKSLILSGVFMGRASSCQPKKMEKNKQKTPFGWDNFHRSHFSLQRGVEEDGC